MINSEDDVRAWVREASGSKARWVEPALGSTPGLPDCWVPWRKLAGVWLELKCGVLIGEELRFSVRPEQRKQIRALDHEGYPVGLLVGIQGTGALVFAVQTADHLTGKIDMSESEGRHWVMRRMDDVYPFQAGVNFIFLKCEERGG